MEALRKLVEELRSRPGTQVVERIVEKPIYQEPGSDVERDVSEREEAEEDFVILDKVAVAEHEAVFDQSAFDKLTKDE